MPRHPDFEKIFKAFMWRYCDQGEGECEEGKSVYYAWLNKMGLDDTKPYARPQEKFQWAQKTIQLLKEDQDYKYYEAEVLFPLSSMNNNLYTRDDLLKNARSLAAASRVGNVMNLNHEEQIDGIQVFSSDVEDDTLEAILQVRKDAVYGGTRYPAYQGKKFVDLIDTEEIQQLSIEGDCTCIGEPDTLTQVNGQSGNWCPGLVIYKLALLTKDILPGFPLTRIMPVEKLVESFTVTEVSSLEGQEQRDKTKNETEKSVENAVASQIIKEVNEYGKAPEETEWDFDVAKYDVDQLRMASAVVTGPSGENGEYVKADCHLPHHLPGDGKTHGGTLVWHGVAAAAAALMGAHDGVKINSEDQTKAKHHLTRHYGEFSKNPPWERKTPCEKATEALTARVETLENELAELKKLKEPSEKRVEQEKLEQNVKIREPKQHEILTREGFWKRFHQLRSEGLSKTDAFRLTSLEVIEAASKKRD
jgi:hypothetical protein